MKRNTCNYRKSWGKASHKYRWSRGKPKADEGNIAICTWMIIHNYLVVGGCIHFFFELQSFICICRKLISSKSISKNDDLQLFEYHLSKSIWFKVIVYLFIFLRLRLCIKSCFLSSSWFFFLGQSMIGIVTCTNLCVCENFSMQNLLERHHNDVTFKECRSGKWCESHLKNRSKFEFHASPINFPHSRKKITQWCNWTIKSWAF